MQKLVFVNGAGNEIDLTSGNFGITNWEGLANTDLNIQTQQVPFEDGGVFLDALLEQREISVTVAIQDNNDLELRYQLKRELISALNPKLGEGVLTYTNDYLSKQIKAVPQIPIFENKNSNDAGTLKASVVFSCPSPYWEDVEENIVSFGLQEQPIIKNEGDIPCQLKMEIVTDNIKNPTVINMNTDKEIKINGDFTENISISTEAGKKSAILNNMKIYLSNFGYNLNSICYCEDMKLYVAVGQYGHFIKSTDGKKWESIINFTQKNILDVIYANGLFVCVGADGVIFTSSNLKTWTERVSGVSYQLNRIAYSEELQLYVAVGYQGVITTSPDGTTWTPRTSGVTVTLNSVKYIEFVHKFVAVGNGKHFLYSDDGETWTDYVYTNYNFNVLDLDFSNDLGIITAVINPLSGIQNHYIISYNGISWGFITTTSSSYEVGTSIDFIKELNFFITNNNYISYDGRYFMQILSDMPQNKKRLAYSSDLDSFVFVGNDIIVKTYGMNSYEVYQSQISESLNDICYSRKLDLFVGVSSAGKIFTSKDKINWIERYSRQNAFNRVIYSEDKGIFIALGNPILYSYDGINWTASTTIIGIATSDVVYSEDKEMFVSVGGTNDSFYNGWISYSYNGINWTAINIDYLHSEYRFVSVCYSKALGKFAAVNLHGVVYTSSNGMQWTGHTVVENSTYTAILYSEAVRKFILIGHSNTLGGILKTSVDGIFWIDESDLIPEGLRISKIYYNPETEMFSGLIQRSGTENSAFISLDMNTIKYYESSCGIKFLKDSYMGWGSEKQIVLSEEIAGENIISSIDKNSDMNLNLQVGDNRFRITLEEGNAVCKISYRQKYIGV